MPPRSRTDHARGVERSAAEGGPPPGRAWRRTTLACALLLSLAAAFEALWMPLRLPQKGSRAPHTLRAPYDFVFNLHEAQQEEIREELGRYLPIYDLDEDLFAERVTAIRREAGLGPAATPEARSPGHGDRPSRRWPEPENVAGRPSEREHDRLAAEARPHRAPSPAARTRRAQLAPAQLAQLDRVLARLEPYYLRGVVADQEFPAPKTQIRLRDRHGYRRLKSSTLVRFSEMARDLVTGFAESPEAAALEAAARFVLDRLPPNVRYAADNADDVADISRVTGVRTVMHRRGDVLVRKGEIVDSRAHSAIKACLDAPHGGRTAYLAALLGLLWTLLLGLGAAGRVVEPSEPKGARALLTTVLGTLVMLAGGRALLALTPLSPVVVPLAWVAMIVAWRFGPAMGTVAAAFAAACAALLFTPDPTLVVPVLTGGMVGAAAVRRHPRSRLAVLYAGAPVALVQAVASQAVRAWQRQAQSLDALGLSVEAFVAGLLAGGLAFIVVIVWRAGESRTVRPAPPPGPLELGPETIPGAG